MATQAQCDAFYTIFQKRLCIFLFIYLFIFWKERITNEMHLNLENKVVSKNVKMPPSFKQQGHSNFRTTNSHIY